jgi:hypothetical protein
MKLLALAIAVLPSVLPRGGTLLELPVDGRADAAKVAAAEKLLEFETWDCSRHPHEDRAGVRLPVCATCQQPMTRVRADAKLARYVRLEVAGDRLRIVCGAWTGVALLRQSAIERALAGTGVSLRATGRQLHGHVVLDVEVADRGRAGLAKALAKFGKAEVPAQGSLVLVRLAEQANGHDHAALVAAVQAAGCTVVDTAWIVNQCSGGLATAR